MKYLVVDYNTYRSCKYRRVEIQAADYLREIVVFERLLSSEERRGAFYNVAERYHEALKRQGVDDYQRYLKLRKIETVDDFYSYFYNFLTRYRRMSAKERVQEAYLSKKMRYNKKELTVLKKATKATCRSICDISARLETTDAALVMREFCKELDKKTGGVSAFVRTHNIESTSELLTLIRIVVKYRENLKDII